MGGPAGDSRQAAGAVGPRQRGQLIPVADTCLPGPSPCPSLHALPAPPPCNVFAKLADNCLRGLPAGCHCPIFFLSFVTKTAIVIFLMIPNFDRFLSIAHERQR